MAEQTAMQIDRTTVLGAFAGLAGIVGFLFRLGRADLAEVRKELETRLAEERAASAALNASLIRALNDNAELRARVAYLEEDADDRHPRTA